MNDDEIRELILTLTAENIKLRSQINSATHESDE